MMTNWFTRQRLLSIPSPRRQRRGARSPVVFRPRLETLEGRVVPAIRTWTGLGADGNWTTAANWQGNLAPNAGDDLVFPGFVQRLSNSDNFPAGTSFNSLTYSGTGYDVAGTSNRLDLGAGGINNTSGTNTFGDVLTVDAVRTITVALGGTFRLANQVTGVGGITKAGAGTLDLQDSGTASNYAGGTIVNTGTLTFEANAALGTGAVTVNATAVLAMGGNLTVTNSLTLNGDGDGNGALQMPFAATDTWSGTVTLNSSSAIGSGFLTINGIISGPPNAALIVERGVLVVTASNTYTGPTIVDNLARLEVEGFQPSSAVTVNGALFGTGTIGTLIVNNNGNLFPGFFGTAPGTLTVNGDVTLGVGSFFDVRLNDRTPGQFSQLKVLGNHLVFLNSPFLLRDDNTLTPVGYQFPIVDATASSHTIGGHFVDPGGNPIGQDGLFSLLGQAFFMHYDNAVTLIRNQGPMAPELDVSPGEVNEGGTVMLTGRLFDPVDPATLALTVDWGDGTDLETYTPGQDPFSIPHIYTHTPPGQAQGGSFTITAHWFDALDQGNSRQLSVIVDNVPPTVFAGDDITLNTGDTLERDGYFTDPGVETWTAQVDYGEGAGWQPLDLNPDMTFHLEHPYDTSGQYQVQVMVTDSNNESGIGSFNVSVEDGGDAPIRPNHPIPTAALLGMPFTAINSTTAHPTAAADAPALSPAVRAEASSAGATPIRPGNADSAPSLVRHVDAVFTGMDSAARWALDPLPAEDFGGWNGRVSL